MERKQESTRDGELKIKSFRIPIRALISQEKRNRTRNKILQMKIYLRIRRSCSRYRHWAGETARSAAGITARCLRRIKEAIL